MRINKQIQRAAFLFAGLALTACATQPQPQSPAPGLAEVEAFAAGTLPDGDRVSFAYALADAAENKGRISQERSGNVVPEDVPLNRFIPFLGREIETLSVIENGEKVEKFWQSLTPEQWRRALSSQHTETTIYKVDKGGSISYLPIASGDLSKGSYQLAYDNFRYKDYPCAADDPGAGRLYVGVGLRIRANINSKKGGFRIGFASFALSASRNEVNGTVSADIVGLANSNTLSQVVGAASGDITYESLIEASNAYAVAGQAIETMVELTNPRIVGYKDSRKAGSCLAAMEKSLGL